MTTATDSEIKQKGLGALMDALGEVDAERFITLLNRDPFDYTMWHQNVFGDKNVREVSADAMAFRKNDKSPK